MSTSRMLIVAVTAALSSLDLCVAQTTQPAATVSAARASDRAPAPAFESRVVADNLVAPWAIGFLPDGRMLVTERSGKVRVLRDEQMLPEPALVVPDIKVWTKMGLLGLAVDPDFTSNGFVYLAECYGGAGDRESWLRVTRYTMSGDKLESPMTLMEGIPAYLNHAGGRIAFGPGGQLYITTGDADRPPTAQDRNSLGGKILRINSDGSIPNDNPFATDANAQHSLWSFGHRNAQGLAFQPRTGRLFAPEHGPNGGDEINEIEAGHNYGWPTVSHQRESEGLTPSLAEFTPSIGPAAATFYEGTMFPELRGNLLVACLRGESILRVTLDKSGESIAHIERMLFKKFGRLREVAVGPDGAIWITTSEVDPPEGRNNPRYDQLIKLTRGSGAGEASAVPGATTRPHSPPASRP